jgi:hypothetical protein
MLIAFSGFFIDGGLQVSTVNVLNSPYHEGKDEKNRNNFIAHYYVRAENISFNRL